MITEKDGVGILKIVVLAGGLSPERDVSLNSGSLIANALARKGHSVLLVDVYEGVKLEDGFTDYDSLFSTRAEYSYKIPEYIPSLEEVKKNNGGQDALIGKNVLEICHAADMVFLALHGAMGENGQLQATLDNYNIKYTGSGYIGSLLAMDKDLAKQLLVRAGVPTADWVTIRTGKDEKINDDVIGEIEEKIGYPSVVKPCSCGSSVGVSLVHNRKQLEEALGFAKEYEGLILVEKMINGRELSVGVMDGSALPPIEIIPKEGFYDYKNKYQSGMTEEICPAQLTDAELKEVSRLAVLAHKTLRLGAYSRVDFILSDGLPVCLEANTLPGMTPNSLFPQMAAAVGIGYDDLCDKLVNLCI